MPTDNPLAIVGMACRLPGADNLDAYWQLIRDGRCAIGELPPDRMRRELFFHPEKGRRAKSYSTIGGVVPPRPVDSSAWRLSDGMLATADVVHLELCAVAEQAFRNGGIDPHDLAGQRAGVYIGHTRGGARSNRLSYATLVEHTAEHLREVPGFDELVRGQTSEVIREVVDATRKDSPKCDETSGPGCDAYDGARIVSEAFGLDGPFLSVDAACASSLMAVTMGMQALQLGVIDMAVVGGASRCEYDTMVLFSKAQSVSAEGSRPFDADADGLVAAEGYVIFVVKTLERALADRDSIQCILRGVGVSSDGRGKSLWAPRKQGQIAAVHRAYDSLEDIGRLQFIEAHATSTQVGDATEISALAEAMSDHLPAGQQVPLGAVKANVGHTLEVAGVAGLLKVILAIQHRTIPPLIGVKQLNPKIDWDRVPFRLPLSEEPWPEPADGTPRRAAVNAFGIGGLNTHAVVEEFVAESLEQGSAISEPTTDFEPIAIIGASANYAGAPSLDAFWDLLQSGRSAITEVPPHRWRADLAYRRGARGPWRSPTRLGGFIEDFQYDWKKHRVPPKQVAKADPLQFMLLDAVDQALGDAGLKTKDFDRSRVGVIVGTAFGGDFSKELQAGIHLPEFQQTLLQVLRRRGLGTEQIDRIFDKYSDILISHLPALEDETGSFTPSTLASRITKTFDLFGGAAAVDCGAASSLGALDICIQMLQTGRNDIMVCAAGQRSMGLCAYERLGTRGWLAGDEVRLPYDAQAEGFVPGEGVGVVILKRLSDARRDGDRVDAVIGGIGSAKRDSLENAVQAAVRRCHRNGHIASHDMATVVTAGCGVASIDKSEIKGLEAGLTDRKERTSLSSVVGQLGHCGGSSGMASLLKGILTLKNKKFTGIASRVQPAPWIADSASLRLQEPGVMDVSGTVLAGVTSHDLNSLAYHVALENQLLVSQDHSTPRSALNARPRVPVASSCRIIRVGADNLPAVFRKCGELLSDPPSWFHKSREEPFSTKDRARLAIVAGSPDELSKKARLTIDQHANPDTRIALMDRGVYFGVAPPRRPQVAFLFSGQASQYPGMLRSLTDSYGPAEQALQTMDVVLAGLGFPSFDEIAWQDGDRLGTDPWRTQMAVLIGDSIMFAALWSLGIRPDRVVGHSFGEWPALWAARAWNFTDAARATDARCRAIADNVPPGGLLLSTTAPRATVEDLCHSTSGVFLTHHNSPQQVVVGGTEVAVMRMKEQLETRGHKTLVLPVPCPFHTPLLAPAAKPLANALRHIPLRPPSIPILSSVTNQYVAEPDEIRANLARQLTEPVQYVELIERLAADGMDIFVEVGPNRVLTRLTREILSSSSSAISLPSDDRNRDGIQSLLQVRACLEVQHALPPQSDDLLDFGEGACEAPIQKDSRAMDTHAETEKISQSSAYQAGLKSGREHARHIVRVLRRNADRAGYNGGFPAALAQVVSEPTQLFSPEELEELKGVADGARVSLPSLIAHNLRVLHRSSGSNDTEPGTLSAPRVGLADVVRRLELAEEPESLGLCRSVVDPKSYLAAPQESDDPENGVCRRFTMRMLPMPLPADSQMKPLSGAAVVHGDNDVARAVCAVLQEAGVRTTLIASTETDECVAALDRAWSQEPVRYLFLTTPYDQVDRGRRQSRPTRDVIVPFLFCQHWHQRLKESNLLSQACAVALPNLGGDFGFSDRVPGPIGGALSGLMKALFVEEAQPAKEAGFRTLSVDFDRSYSAEQIAKAVYSEIERRTLEVEVGYLSQRRHVVRAVRGVTPAPHQEVELRDSVWVVTGGARGVTALVARELARQFGWRLHLIGASPAPEVRPEWRGLTDKQKQALRKSIMQSARAEGEQPRLAWTRVEKAIEIDANLAAFRQAGVSARYHACDIGDRDSLAAVLEAIRQEDGPLVGILHGAGFEKSCRFKSKSRELLERTLGAKVDGAAWLMELSQNDPLRYFVGFGSTSGGLGSHGQADYCAANDMLAKLIARFRSERPDCHAALFHWHAWDEVGMAVRPEVAGVLKSFGLHFMPTAEGIGFLKDELRAGLPESEVLITEWSHYRKLRPQTASDTALLRSKHVPTLAECPLVDEIQSHEPGQQITAITRLDPVRDPFLVQHTLRGKPVLPMVMALEAFAESASLLAGQPVRAFRNIKVLNPLRFFTDRVQSARTRVTKSEGQWDCQLLCDFVNQRGVTMKENRLHLQATAIVDQPELPPPAETSDPSQWYEVNYPDEQHVIYHGPALRCFQGAFGDRSEAVARVVAPESLAELGGSRQGSAWAFSPAALDACFYAAGGHLWFFCDRAVGIPQMIDRLVLGRQPQPGEDCRLSVRFLDQSEEHGVFDLTLRGEDGQVIFMIDGYHNVVIPGTRA